MSGFSGWTAYREGQNSGTTDVDHSLINLSTQKAFADNARSPAPGKPVKRDIYREQNSVTSLHLGSEVRGVLEQIVN